MLDTNLCITYANPFAHTFFEKADQLQTKNARELFPETPFPKLGNTAFSILDATGEWKGTTEYSNASGIAFTMQLHVIKTKDRSGSCLG